MMYKKIISFFIMGVFCVVAAGFIFEGAHTDGILRTFNVKIEKSNDGTWRVRDNNGNNKGTLSVQAGDDISWHARGSDMVFIFSKDAGDYFEYDEGQFSDGRTQKITKNKKLHLTLKEDAPKGPLTYEVYVVSEGKSVVGNSPPRLIIY